MEDDPLNARNRDTMALTPEYIRRFILGALDPGFFNSKLELYLGYPGYFYSPGDGDYIYAVDEEYGLPMRKGGDANPNTLWMSSFNRGVLAYTKQHGLPWNSRLSSLDVLSDLPGYFGRKASECVRLEADGAVYKPEGFGFALSLAMGEMESSVKLESTSLFHDPKIVPRAMWAYRTGPPPADVPAVPLPPPLKPGTKSIGLWSYSGARSIECVPAPSGSHLVVFRFSDFEPNPGISRQTEECFAALDTQMAAWLPGTLSQHSRDFLW